MAGGNYDNTNKGAIFKNNRKTTDRHPDMTGKLNVDGKDYWISGWTCYKRQGGEKYLQLSITPVEEKPRETNYNANDEMDDAPF